MTTQAKSKKVLIALTSHDQLGDTGRATGYYLPEVSHPVVQLERNGITVDLVSPKGGLAPMDPSSRNLSDPINKEFLSRPDLVSKIENSLRAEDVIPSEYSAILYAGGHGTMWDFPQDSALAKIASEIYENGGVVAAVCHGPAALLNIKLKDGTHLLEGRQVTGFSNSEEEAAKLTQVMPFLLESELIDRGASYSKAGLWEKHVVVDGRLITGQNPASAEGVGRAVASAVLALK